MKIFKYSVFLFSLLLFLQCRKENVVVKNSSDSTKISAKISSDYRLLLKKLLILQNEITLTPKDKQLQQKLLTISFDTISGCFITAGQGIFTNKHPKTIDEQLRLKAARMVAQRWALYLKFWHIGKNIDFGDNVSGSITYDKDIYSEIHNDTLCLIVQTPLGAISN